jgi:hypothetical protein
MEGCMVTTIGLLLGMTMSIPKLKHVFCRFDSEIRYIRRTISFGPNFFGVN